MAEIQFLPLFCRIVDNIIGKRFVLVYCDIHEQEQLTMSAIRSVVKRAIICFILFILFAN